MVEKVHGPFEYYEAGNPHVNGRTIRSSMAGPALKNQDPADIRDDDLAAARATYATGLIRSFGILVEQYDATVGEINADYWTDLRERHAQHAQGDDEETAFDWDGRGAEVYAELLPRWESARATVDAGAAEIARKLGEGPTPENVGDLIRDRLIPIEMAFLFPGVPLSDADRIVYYGPLPTDGE